MSATQATAYSDIDVLVFSKTAGYRHEAIETAKPVIRTLSPGIRVTESEDSSVFEAEGLKKYQVVVFLMTSGNIMEPAEKEAFEGYIAAGGGFVAIHSAIDTEYEWPFYGELVGAYFLAHPHIQNATVRLEDAEHVTTRMMPAEWNRADEWYDLRTNPRGKVHVLATLDGTTYEGSQMNGDHPIIWCSENGSQRTWVNLFGHTDETWENPVFLESLTAGIRWAAHQVS